VITPESVSGWTEFPIPGGTAPVPIVRLRSDETSRAQTLFVRFPAGWSRPVSGFYEAAEELVVIRGVLHMSGVTYRAGDWGYVPAGSVRSWTEAAEECLVFARFDGPARWRETSESGAPTPMVKTMFGSLHDDAAHTVEPSPLGNRLARRLRRGERDAAWLAESVEAGAPAAVTAELFDLTQAAYAFVVAGDPLPACGGPCFVRTFGGEV